MLAGSLNPAILSTAWVVKNHVLPGDKKTEEGILLGPGASGPRCRVGEIVWQPDFDRLEVFALSEAADAGIFVARVLDLLRHTPVAGVGNNFTLEVSHLTSRLVPMFEPAAARLSLHPDAREEPVGFEATLQLAGDGLALNISYGKANLSHLRLNFHRDARNASDASKAAGLWKADRARALKVLDWLVGERGLND